MNTIQKINALNKACKYSLGLQHYQDSKGWQISSFQHETPLNMKNHYPYFTGHTLKEVVDIAYEFVFSSK